MTSPFGDNVKGLEDIEAEEKKKIAIGRALNMKEFAEDFKLFHDTLVKAGFMPAPGVEPLDYPTSAGLYRTFLEQQRPTSVPRQNSRGSSGRGTQNRGGDWKNSERGQLPPSQNQMNFIQKQFDSGGLTQEDLDRIAPGGNITRAAASDLIDLAKRREAGEDTATTAAAGALPANFDTASLFGGPPTPPSALKGFPPLDEDVPF